MRCRSCQRQIGAYAKHASNISQKTRGLSTSIVVRRDDGSAGQPSALSTNWKSTKASIENRLSSLSRDISRYSGYEAIESLKQSVESHEKLLETARSVANSAKAAYTQAVQSRAATQRDSTNLLSRKDTWTSSDVSRFTELVKQDHLNEQAEREGKLESEAADKEVDKIFVSLIRAILARYHEEQVWSDKIRSMSTYGSLAITATNVCIFLIALIIIEPWRRRKLIERLELQMADRESQILSQSEQSFLAILKEVSNVKQELQLADAIKTGPEDDIHYREAPQRTTSDQSLVFAAAGLAVGLTLSICSLALSQ